MFYDARKELPNLLCCNKGEAKEDRLFLQSLAVTFGWPFSRFSSLLSS